MRLLPERRTAQVVDYRTELRAPTTAMQATSYQAPGQPIPLDWNPDQAIDFAYYANIFVYACVRAIAADLSRLPIRLGDPDARTIDTQHPMAWHFSPPPGGPNPATSARKLIAWSIAQYLVTGRVSWEIESNVPHGTPVAYWPLPSSRVRPLPSDSGVSYWAGFEVGPEHNPKRLTPEQVFYTWEPAAKDWRQPESRLQAARLAVSIAVMQDRYDYAFLKNGSVPAAIVVHEAFQNLDEQRAWRRQFVARHGGPDNAGQIAFTEAEPGPDGSLAGAIDVKTLGLSQKDAQAIQRYDQKLREITVAFGVPVSRLGDSSDRTFSNAGQEWTNYWQGTLLPIALDFADAMNMQLLPRYSRSGAAICYFDTSSVAALNGGVNIAQVSPREMLDAGAISLNDSRALVGLPPVPDPAFDLYEKAPDPVPMALPPPVAAAPKAGSGPRS